MASDHDIAQGLEDLFRETNPRSFNSLNEVILTLQSKLGFDLSHKVDFIRAHISLIFNAASPLPAVGVNPNPNTSVNVNVVHHRGFQSPSPSPGPGPMVVGQSYFPRGPTEISFAQPGIGGSVVTENLSSPTESGQGRPKRRGGAGGLNKLCGVSPQLQTIVGQPAMPRTEIVKQLWAYIRKNNLQDPSNKRKIICNDDLRLLFEVDCTDMFQMNKLLAKHISPLDPAKVGEQPAKKAKVEESNVPSTESSAPGPDPAPAPMLISETLAKFLGTSEKEMLKSEVYIRIEEYIKTEGLEDPLNSMVICDPKLQELLGCESIPTPGVRDALARNHLFPRV